jgi:putative ABC transport system permease protein
MVALWKDLSVAIRQFRRRPGFALAVVSTLALAIGANIAVFSVVNAVLFRALPFRAPERLVWIASVRPDNPAAPFTLPEFMDYRSAALGGCFAAVARPLVSRLAQDVSIPLGSAIMTTGLLLVLVTLAAWLPARRAARIPPTIALRGE